MKVECHLRSLRDARKLSLRGLAEETGIARGTLSQIENGRRFPSDAEATLLEHAFQTPREQWYPTHVVVELSPDKEQA